MPSPRGSSQPRDRTQVSHMEDSLLSEPPRKSMNTGVLPSPGDPPNSGIKLGSPVLEAYSLPTKLQGKPKKLDTFQVQRQGNKYVFLPLLFNIILEVLAIALSRAQLCDPMDCSPPGSSVHRISQARVLEWVVIFSSRGSSWPRDRTQVCCIAGGFFTIWATREASYKGLLSSCKHVFRSDSSKWKCEAKECLFSVLMHAAKFCFSKAVPIYILMPTVHSPCLFACSSFSLALTDSFSILPQVSSSFLWASWSDRSYSSVTRGSHFIFIHSHVWVPQATILHCHWKTLTKLKVVNNINVYMYIFIHLAVYLFIWVLVAACGI